MVVAAKQASVTWHALKSARYHRALMMMRSAVMRAIQAAGRSMVTGINGSAARWTVMAMLTLPFPVGVRKRMTSPIRNAAPQAISAWALGAGPRQTAKMIAPTVRNTTPVMYERVAEERIGSDDGFADMLCLDSARYLMASLSR